MKRLLILLLLAVALTACAVAAPASAPSIDVQATEVVEGCGVGSVCVTITPVPSPTCPCPTCPAAGPTPTGTPAATATAQPSKPACWDPYLDTLGVTVERRNGSYRLIAAWTTTDGQWDPVIACAKQWQKDTLGGDHNAFGRAQVSNDIALPETFALIWPGGGDTRLPEADGWANMPMTGHNWDPAGGPGSYTMFFFGGDKLVGFDMPNNRHVSFFGVWQYVTPGSALKAYDAQIMGGQ